MTALSESASPPRESPREPIYETVVTSCSAEGSVHIAPLGIRYRDGDVLLMPFRPSTTLANIEATGSAVLNLLTDARVFAGCITGRREWPTRPVESPEGFRGVRLAAALGHVALRLAERQDADADRPTLVMRRLAEAQHAAFPGLNRAQAAVVEGAVLVSRLRLLPAGRIDAEFRYLRIAIDRTAGDAEREAWGWLEEAVARHRGGETAARIEARE